jgi:hypothetical protein
MKLHWFSFISLALPLLASGCHPAPSTSPGAPPAPAGVTSSTERALDSQPGAGSVRGTVARDEGLVDLKEIAMFYQLHQSDGAQARELVLKDLQHDHGKLYQAIQEGRYILLSGDPSNTPAGASNTIVAYMPNAPTMGGVVALADGSARNMPTPQEFQAAAKLGQ